jgi:hypothetical protein
MEDLEVAEIVCMPAKYKQERTTARHITCLLPRRNIPLEMIVDDEVTI